MKEFKLPALGENITHGQIVKLLVEVGNKVNAGQAILEIETDKSLIEVPIEESGTIKEILIKAGTAAEVGSVLLKYESESTLEKTTNSEKQIQENEAPPLPVPEETTFSEKESLPSIPKNPPSTSVELALMHLQKSLPSSLPKNITPEGMGQKRDARSVAAAPSARREAREIGIDITQVQSSRSDGRITRMDVRAHAKAINSLQQNPIKEKKEVTEQPLPDFSKFGAIEKVAMTQVRKITAQRLTASWQTIPHVTQFDLADVTTLETLRKRYAKRAEEAGGKLTITVILMKIITSALKVFPQFNASIDISKNEIIYKKYFNIGIAVDTPRGLLVPVVHDVDKKNIISLAKELGEISKLAREGRTPPDMMKGGSITITNLGSIGGTYFTPIINAPEVAILGVSRGRKELYLTEEGKPAERELLPLSLSYDHRLIDGADAARFLRWIADAVQDPFLMDLEG